jgi:hypothetical protein
VPLAHELGAHHYIDNAAEDPAAALQISLYHERASGQRLGTK